MATKREIENLFCIFNLSIYRALHLDQPLFARVLLIYDKRKNKKEIKILRKGISDEMQSRLTSWLDKNVEIDEILYHIRSEEIDMDELKKVSNY